VPGVIQTKQPIRPILNPAALDVSNGKSVHRHLASLETINWLAMTTAAHRNIPKRTLKSALGVIRKSDV
jgi:hypothetical protein